MVFSSENVQEGEPPSESQKRIEKPVPHRKVYFGIGKNSDAEPLHEMVAWR